MGKYRTHQKSKSRGCLYPIAIAIEAVVSRLLMFPIICVIYIFKGCWKFIKLITNSSKRCYRSVPPTIKQSTDDTIPSTINKPYYIRKELLTAHEQSFYQELKKIADSLNYIVLAKIRMADLVEPVEHTQKEYYSSFAKIKAKHVDFALAKKENMYIELLIELDDRSHVPGNERDAFVEYVYALTKYKLLRYQDGQDLQQMIADKLSTQIKT